MKKNTCKECTYYYQHYLPDDAKGKRYTPIFCGHCVYPRIKTRKPFSPACVHFIPLQTEDTPPAE